jgi:hypothetical protein
VSGQTGHILFDVALQRCIAGFVLFGFEVFFGCGLAVFFTVGFFKVHW